MKRAPLKRYKRLSHVSSKRRKEGALYGWKRNIFLRLRPTCERWGRVMNGGDVLGVPTKYLIGTCGRIATDVHHMKGRLGGNYLDDNTWLPVCRECHDWIHAHPREARELGLPE
jgi:hypothetical protein